MIPPLHCHQTLSIDASTRIAAKFTSDVLISLAKSAFTNHFEVLHVALILFVFVQAFAAVLGSVAGARLFARLLLD